ncbi:MAG: nickel-dependent lactate racemase [Chitinophagales bacterium]
MDFTWKYGKRDISFSIPDNRIEAIIERPSSSQMMDEKELVNNALNNPIGSEGLRELVKKKGGANAVVVINDITRPTPYKIMLPGLLQELEAGGIAPDQITLLVANGIHRAQTEKENEELYGQEICHKYKVVNHNPDQDLVNLGRLSGGIELLVNRRAVEAGILVTTGLVGLHYFAGYSGGRKSIVPGIAGRATIEASHSMMADPRARLGNIHDNPVHHILLEAAQKVGVDFILNVLTDDHKKIAAAVAGDLEAAWLRGTEICRASSVYRLNKQADIVVAGCGGHPKDINLYQAQKALDSAAQAVKPGGVIILAAQCGEGMGEDTFSRWVNEANTPEDIKERFKNHFELGGHKAFAICGVLDKCDIVLVSDMDPELVKKAFMIPASSIEAGLEYAYANLGPEAGIAVIPEAPTLAMELG